MDMPLPEPAVPPTDDIELQRLDAEAAALLPTLAKFDSGQSLGPILNLVTQAKVLGARGFDTLKRFAAQLRANRVFDDLYVLTNEMRSAGMTDLDIQRWEIQALIELGVFDRALELAAPLAAKGPATREGEDGLSAMGRIYKQMYVDGAMGKRLDEPAVRAVFIERAFSAYLRVWEHSQTEANAYYGVNALALAFRAIRDRVSPDDPSAQGLARQVLAAVSQPTTVWSWGTQGEALIALGQYADAAKAYATFALSPDVSLFQLNASLRQLEEVWQISGDDAERGAPVRLLKAIMVSKLNKNGHTSKDAPQAAQVRMSTRETFLIERELKDGGGQDNPKGFEQIFSTNAPVALQVIQHAIQRARAICRIHAQMGGRDTPFATGFAMRGDLLRPEWGADPVIVTNNHVISTRPNKTSQMAEYCEAVFVCPDLREGMHTDETQARVGFAEVLWESDQDSHDITVLRPSQALPSHIEPISSVSRRPLPPHAVDDDGIGRLYVIGYPAAGDLSFSFADNIFLDHDAPMATEESAGDFDQTAHVQPEPVHLHYKTPTLGGSSGSPVFDFNDFQLLAVHHRGMLEASRLNARGGRYAANQGIWIESIRAAISETFGEASEAGMTGGRRWRSTPLSALAAGESMPSAPSAPPIVAAPLSGAPVHSGPRVTPGSLGDASLGRSVAAEQLLKSGRASAEEIANISNESIIGIDGRTRILDTSMSPWRMLCAIRCHWGTRLAVGTGFLIGPDMLVTAGHVVFPKSIQSLPDRIEIIPALNVTDRPFGAFGARSVSVHPRWQTGFEITCDVAAIHLEQAVGEKVGWYGLAVRTPDDLSSRWSHVTGYPGEKLDQPRDPSSGAPLPPLPASQMWHHASPILGVKNGRIFYATDTTPGQSGAPIYVIEPDASPTPVVIGVHAYGKASTPVAVGEANSGALIDADLFDLLQSWKAAAGGRSE